MKKIFFIFASILILCSLTLQAQHLKEEIIKPAISSRIDTTSIVQHKLYHLYTNYINSKPDSIYINPHWNKDEAEKAVAHRLLPDQSAKHMFYIDAKRFLRTWSPTILQIEEVDAERYMIKVIFASSKAEMAMHSPHSITRLYAVSHNNGEDYKLENVRDYDCKSWTIIDKEYITYYVHPSIEFNEERANDAISFCNNIIVQFQLKDYLKISYYVTPDIDEMWRLHNFDFYMYGGYGLADISCSTLYTARGIENFHHELVHLIMPQPKSPNTSRHDLITEGVATWLGGPDYNQTFRHALTALSKQFKSNPPQSLEDIIFNRYRNNANNNVLYVTGAVICNLIWNRFGAEDFWNVYNCPNDWQQLKDILCTTFNMPYCDFEKMIIAYIQAQEDKE